MAEPVLKWAGGKRQLLDDLYARFPKEYNRYHEPMIGGGAVFFDLEPESGTINDTNPKLINFYKQVRNNPEELIEKCDSFKDPGSEPDPSKPFSETDRSGKEITNYYYQQRARFNKRPHNEEYNEIEEAALLLYLNRTCFNGLYRENNEGAFNVPEGRYSNPDWVRENEIQECSRVLNHLDEDDIRNSDYKYVLEEAEQGDLVYFDPPYEPMSPTEYFTDYSKEGFGQEDQEELLDAAVELDEEGVHVILSNSGVMYEMYEERGFYVEKEGATRAINSDGENRGEVDEIIATNIPPENRGMVGQRGITEF